jgi:hypothetical protein
VRHAGQQQGLAREGGACGGAVRGVVLHGFWRQESGDGACTARGPGRKSSHQCPDERNFQFQPARNFPRIRVPTWTGFEPSPPDELR